MTSDRVPLQRSDQQQREEDEFQALYGRWAPLTPAEIGHLLAGSHRPWWIVGGWAIEAATAVLRDWFNEQHATPTAPLFPPSGHHPQPRCRRTPPRPLHRQGRRELPTAPRGKTFRIIEGPFER